VAFARRRPSLAKKTERVGVALGVRCGLGGARNRRARLVETLADKACLIVLDDVREIARGRVVPESPRKLLPRSPHDVRAQRRLSASDDSCAEVSARARPRRSCASDLFALGRQMIGKDDREKTITYATAVGAKFPKLSQVVRPDSVAVGIAEVDGVRQGGSTRLPVLGLCV